MPATVRQYELVYIIHPDRSDEQVQGVIAKYNNLIATQGGQVERTDIWERRRLAYPIAGQHDGIYIICIFRGLPNVEAELRRVFRISEDTLRFIIVRPDEEIDASVPSVQPREYGMRAQPQYQAQNLAPANAPAPVAAVAAAIAAVTPDSGDSAGPAAGTATSVAAAASDEGVPGLAASDEGTEAEIDAGAAPKEAEAVGAA